MKSLIKIIIVLLVIFISGCETYPDWENYVEYSDGYPICGEYYVRDFDANTDTIVEDWYVLYIYNKSYNPTKDSMWIDNRIGHPSLVSTYDYKYKIKCKVDTINLSFDVDRAGEVTGSNLNPKDSAISVSISNSKIFKISQGIEDAAADSIYFDLLYYDKYGDLKRSLKVAGHRKTGWEFPNFDDNM